MTPANTRLSTKAVFAIALSLCTAACARADQEYKITNKVDRWGDIQTERHFTDCDAAGMMVGWNFEALIEGQGYYTYGTVAFPSPAYKGGTVNTQYDVNDHGMIVGTMTPGSSGQNPSFAGVTMNGSVRTLGAGAGIAYSVNNNDVVLGTGAGKGSLWTWDSKTDTYNTIVPGTASPKNGQPRINDKGQAVAWTNSSRVFYDPNTGVHSLPTSVTYPTGLNNNTDIVGNTSTDPNVSAATILLSDGQTVSLSSLNGGRHTYALGISDTGVVALLAQGNGWTVTTIPMIWDATHGLRNLSSDLISPADDPNKWRVSEILNISPSGQILCVVEQLFFPGNAYFAVLEPVPAPGALVLGGLALCMHRRGRAETR